MLFFQNNYFALGMCVYKKNDYQKLLYVFYKLLLHYINNIYMNTNTEEIF